MLNTSVINNRILNQPLLLKKSNSGTSTSEIKNQLDKYSKYNSTNLKAYHPSFSSKITKAPSPDEQLNTVKSKLDAKTQAKLNELSIKGILSNKDSNDGSTVLDNLYKIATEPRIRGIKDSQILTDVITALDNPCTITQRIGDIPKEVRNQVISETGCEEGDVTKKIHSSCCVVASIEYNLASKKPAEFARFAQGLSSENYSVDKNIDITAFSDGLADALSKLRDFNTENTINKNGKNVTIKIKPDRNAIVRARIQSTYRDANERSVVDVLIQSALINFASQNTYNTLTDERAQTKFNDDTKGLGVEEKSFVEQVVFESPIVPVIYQNIDQNNYLTGRHCELNEIKRHILNTLNLGQNVIVGYTDLKNNKVENGHEITITGYETDKDGNVIFIYNDTDDGEDKPVRISESKLLPIIHHAGIPTAALRKDDVIVENWKVILEDAKNLINNKQATAK